MAQLNLRDHVIETTIAYVGATYGVCAESFEHIARVAPRGRATSVEKATREGADFLEMSFRPEDRRWNDCDLSVRLVAWGGAHEGEAAARALADADAIVVLLESREAKETNERAVESVRRALRASRDEPVPVLVQMNRAAEGDAEPAIDVGDWRRVPSRARTGEGVMETLQKAVEGVVATMQRSGHKEDEAPRANGARTEGNPLLEALRQILREAVREEIAAFEERMRAEAKARTEAILAELSEQRRTMKDELARGVVTATTPLQRAIYTLSVEAQESQRIASGEATTIALAQMATKVDALVEELRRKKSWFG